MIYDSSVDPWAGDPWAMAVHGRVTAEHQPVFGTQVFPNDESPYSLTG